MGNATTIRNKHLFGPPKQAFSGDLNNACTFHQRWLQSSIKTNNFSSKMSVPNLNESNEI